MFKKNQEYQDVLYYMVKVLGNEFPTEEFTPEYLMLAILDSSKCHANYIIDNFLMSESMEQLRSYYHTELKFMDKKPIIKGKSERYSKELSDILDAAEKEAEKMGNSKSKKGDDYTVGTEHVIMAILNPENHFSSAKPLKDYDLQYDHVSNKGYSFPEEKNKYINNNGGDSKIPLKSEVHSKLVISSKDTPNIKRYTINIHDELAKNGHDSLIGREDVIDKVIKVLSRRKKNNAIIVGTHGVGKTSIAYRLAEMIDDGMVPDILSNKKVIMLDVMGLISGTHLRGMFEERVDGLFKELQNSKEYILFIDDMQNVLRNTGKDKDCDLTDVIGNILSEGDVRVIGTISFKDYRNGIEANSTLSNKLQKIVMEPSSEEETIKILNMNKHYYENFHHVKFSDSVIRKSVSLAKRYITNNSLPDSAIDIIDLTGASVSLSKKQEARIKNLKSRLSSLDNDKKEAMDNGDFEKLDEISKTESRINKEIMDVKREIDNNEDSWITVTEDNISDTVSSMTNIPISRLKSSEKETIMHIEEILKKDVIGQDEAIKEIAKVMKRSKAGFGDKSKVMATLMYLGPSGIGKTLISKKLAENIFGSENFLVRFDMSEFQDKSSINKLIGSSAGYVGYENGGLLTEAVKNKPYCVLLFDEIEKADESIYNLFLQLFDEGRLTDNNGTTVNFKNVIVIMTSNVGARQASERGNGIGFMADSESNKRSIIEKSLKSKFNPEFLNRIDKIIHFNPLTDENLHTIVTKELDKLCDRVKENEIELTYDQKIVEHVYRQALTQKEYGARPIMRIIQDDISDKVVDLVLTSDKSAGSYSVTVNDEGEVVASITKN
jgi:ATP-dependent Clp protease ATP-binding subunit ClpC